MSDPENLVLAHLRQFRASIESRIEKLERDLKRQERRFDSGERRGFYYLRVFSGHRNMVQHSFAGVEEDLAMLNSRMTALENTFSGV